MESAYGHDLLARYHFERDLKDHGYSRLAWGQIDGSFEDIYLANSTLPEDQFDLQAYLGVATVDLEWQTTGEAQGNLLRNDRDRDSIRMSVKPW